MTRRELIWRGVKLTIEGLVMGAIFVWALSQMVSFGLALLAWIWLLTLVLAWLARRPRP